MENKFSYRKAWKVTFPVPWRFEDWGLHLLFKSFFLPDRELQEGKDGSTSWPLSCQHVAQHQAQGMSAVGMCDMKE